MAKELERLLEKQRAASLLQEEGGQECMYNEYIETGGAGALSHSPFSLLLVSLHSAHTMIDRMTT